MPGSLIRRLYYRADATAFVVATSSPIHQHISASNLKFLFIVSEEGDFLDFDDEKCAEKINCDEKLWRTFKINLKRNIICVLLFLKLIFFCFCNFLFIYFFYIMCLLLFNLLFLYLYNFFYNCVFFFQADHIFSIGFCGFTVRDSICIR